MFGFVKKMFIGLLSVCTTGRFCDLFTSRLREPIKRVYLNNQPCQAIPIIVDIKPDKTFFFNY